VSKIAPIAVAIVIVLGIYAASVFLRVGSLEKTAAEKVEAMMIQIAVPWDATEIRALASPAMIDMEGETIEKKAEIVSRTLGGLLEVQSVDCESKAVRWRYADKEQVLSECEVEALFEKTRDRIVRLSVFAVKAGPEWKLGGYGFHDVDFAE